MSSNEQLQNDLLAMLSAGLKKNVQMSDNVFDLGADSLDLQTVTILVWFCEPHCLNTI